MASERWLRDGRNIRHSRGTEDRKPLGRKVYRGCYFCPLIYETQRQLELRLAGMQFSRGILRLSLGSYDSLFHGELVEKFSWLMVILATIFRSLLPRNSRGIVSPTRYFRVLLIRSRVFGTHRFVIGDVT